MENNASLSSDALAQSGINGFDPGMENANALIEHDGLQVAESGWHNENTTILPLLGSLEREDFWALLRRFKKQVFHVKRVEERPLSGLDMNTTEEDITSEKLQAQAERLYMVVIVRLFALIRYDVTCAR